MVGTPVTRRPPCRPGRAVFPHPVPRLHSRPRRAAPLPVLALFAMARREVGSYCSGPTCPGCVSFPGCGRPSRPSRVVGLPHRSVLRAIRLPNRIWRAFPLPVLLRRPRTRCVTARRFPQCSVSGLPLPCLKSCRPYTVASPVQELLGSPTCFDASLPACPGLRTPADLPLLAHTDGLVWPSVCVKTLGIRNTRPCEAVPALQGTRLPLRPPGYAVDASSLLCAASSSRRRHGCKTRDGWVATPYPTGTFTLPETPSFLGAITPAVSRARKLKRSGSCRASAPVRC